ncbi:Tumor necrosis factor ligand superfamily member 12 TNF-related weak inducer of apoptosis [Channa argus]|uniref:Tumor necrosis factor ligand superfamily member 12 TNF-related weak inducer of apoptosis n=1 Tax=Channa argus TaxID=215402 RepID=A0A6G1Q5Q3_CHAAH|nr:Tumor necrosis factor ligand superfamily member 12 TNF-related weak inducer of apoptosis [Channa argus]
MHRILQRRRVRKLRVVWASLALVALSLAACSALFTAWTWRQTRDLSQSFKILQDRLDQVNTQRKAIVQLILEKRELLVGQRVKRDGGAVRGRNGNGNGNGKKAASHFEITKVSSQQEGGVIKGWEERTLNMSRAVTYNKEQGTFTVERAGVYFLFCQLHCSKMGAWKYHDSLVLFNDKQTQYVKLDVVTTGQRPQKLQCIEGYATTPSAGPHAFHFVKSCQVSGLLRLDRGTELQAITGPSFRLHTVGSPSASPHVFSIFKVN